MNRTAPLLILLVAFAACSEEGDPAVLADLEAVVAAGKAEPVEGITAAGQPDPEALQVFAESGYTVVVDMRGPDEDRGIDDFPGVVEATGMKYVAFPVVDADEINFETAARLDEMLSGMEGPVLLHCASGNRVGALLALRESLRGADDESAIAFGKDAGMTRLEPRVRELLEAE